MVSLSVWNSAVVGGEPGISTRSTTGSSILFEASMAQYSTYNNTIWPRDVSTSMHPAVAGTVLS